MSHYLDIDVCVCVINKLLLDFSRLFCVPLKVQLFRKRENSRDLTHSGVEYSGLIQFCAAWLDEIWVQLSVVFSEFLTRQHVVVFTSFTNLAQFVFCSEGSVSGDVAVQTDVTARNRTRLSRCVMVNFAWLLFMWQNHSWTIWIIKWLTGNLN